MSNHHQKTFPRAHNYFLMLDRVQAELIVSTSVTHAVSKRELLCDTDSVPLSPGDPRHQSGW